jgi:hypothetical protein
LDLKTSIQKKKYCRSNFFSKHQDGGVIQDGATNHCYILSGLAQSFLNRLQHISLFWPCKTQHFHIPKNNSIQNGVNIQDGDFTFIYPSVRGEICIFVIFKPTIFKFWILIEDYIRINETFGFFDSLPKSSEIGFGLGPSQIMIFLNLISSLLEDFPDRY